MIDSRAYHGLNFVIARNDSDRICYVLLPEGLHEDGMKMVESSSEKYGCNIVLVTGMNWNRDLTPWQAPGVFKSEKPFEGRANDFLKELMQDYFPGIEQSLGMNKPQRYLVGISLSGLFAIWTLFKTDTFKSIGSISGSLWYDNLLSWIESQDLKNDSIKVHLSLGDREKNSKDKRMATVENASLAIAHILGEKGCNVDFNLVPGTHFSPIIPRLEMAFDSILG